MNTVNVHFIGYNKKDLPVYGFFVGDELKEKSTNKDFLIKEMEKVKGQKYCRVCGMFEKTCMCSSK
jgi:hypothetical protein